MMRMCEPWIASHQGVKYAASGSTKSASSRPPGRGLPLLFKRSARCRARDSQSQLGMLEVRPRPPEITGHMPGERSTLGRVQHVFLVERGHLGVTLHDNERA